MTDYRIRPADPGDVAWIKNLICEHWGDETVIVHGDCYRPQELPGFLAESGGRNRGLITYRLDGEDCEIVSLDSLDRGKGIGRALVGAVVDAARRAGCRRLRVTTTNDNLRALRFYQRIGFTLAALRPNALAETRKRKSVPAAGEDGIPIRDEIELARPLD
ncbi:MAG: GNAT family N-acetyltransferase [Anaerolineales bacterium]|nr:GNAT family N-acetyltransferase [Anaerolineales bacterium]